MSLKIIPDLYYFISFYMTFQNNVQKVKKIDFLALVSQSLHSRTF